MADPESDGAWLDRTVRRTAVILLMIGVALLLVQLAQVLLLLFGAILIAVVLRAIAEPLERYLHLPKRAGVIVALLLVTGVIALVIWLFGVQISGQFTELAMRLPQAWEQIRGWIAQMPWGDRIVASLDHAEPSALSLLSNIGGWVLRLGGALSELLIVLFAGVYLALSPRIYRAGVVKLFPKGRGEQVADTLDTIGRALRLWLMGQLVSMGLVGFMTWLGLWLVGVPSPLALGLIAGVAEFIPWVGPILSAIPGLLLAFTAGPSTLLWAVVVYVFVQQSEGDLIMPLVVRWAVSVPPVVHLIGVLALGLLFGPLGVLLAAPLVVVLLVLVKRLYVRDTLGHETEIPGERDG